jgi:hypothetical protein
MDAAMALYVAREGDRRSVRHTNDPILLVRLYSFHEVFEDIARERLQGGGVPWVTIKFVIDELAADDYLSVLDRTKADHFVVLSRVFIAVPISK